MRVSYFRFRIYLFTSNHGKQIMTSLSHTCNLVMGRYYIFEIDTISIFLTTKYRLYQQFYNANPSPSGVKYGSVFYRAMLPTILRKTGNNYWSIEKFHGMPS